MFDIGELVPIVAVLGPAVVLPIVIVYLSLKHKTESEKVKKDIILAALEKDATIDVEELVKKINDRVWEENETEHLGVRNSIRRLEYVYGKNASVKVRSKLGEGTTFVISFPYKLEVEE